MSATKEATFLLVYGMILLHVYVWFIWPEFLTEAMWKWDVFMVLLIAPILYLNRRDERKN